MLLACCAMRYFCSQGFLAFSLQESSYRVKIVFSRGIFSHCIYHICDSLHFKCLDPGKKRVDELNVLMLKMPGLVCDKSVVTLIYVSYKVSVSSNTRVINTFTQSFLPRSRDDQCVPLTILLISIVLESHWRASSTWKMHILVCLHNRKESSFVIITVEQGRV